MSSRSIRLSSRQLRSSGGGSSNEATPTSPRRTPTSPRASTTSAPGVAPGYKPRFPFSAYITAEGVKQLSAYKYHGVDNSLIANYVLQPFWKWGVNFLPIWLAPNMVTLLGWLAMLFAYLLTAYYCPNITETAPRWVYFTCAICMWIYETMDAMDGKQARRTGTSSPLGELFDHGCDALTTMLTLISISCALQLGPSASYYITALCAYLGFYFAQWEEYHTHVMDLGYYGVTEAQLLYMAIMVVTGIYGPQFWARPVFDGVQYKHVIAGLTWIGTAGALFINFWKVVGVVRKQEARWADVLVRCVPGVIVHLFAFVWAVVSPQHIAQTEPHMFVNLIGLLVSYIVGRVILARVTRDRYLLVPKALLPFPLVITNSLINHYWPDRALVSDRMALYAYLVFALVLYLYYALSVIFQICAVLNIRALTIAPEQVELIRKKLESENREK